MKSGNIFFTRGETQGVLTVRHRANGSHESIGYIDNHGNFNTEGSPHANNLSGEDTQTIGRKCIEVGEMMKRLLEQ